MARDGFFTGLDIGTSSIKVLVAEFIDGSMNVIGVSNVKSSGVKDGIIVDIDAAAKSIKTAIEQAEEKAGIVIEQVNVGLPANLLQIEPTQGMIPVSSESKEIKDEDVESVVRSALTKSITPEREVISLVPEEFIVDGFQGIHDPRGMMGIRLEMRGLIYTGPTTILHNIRKTVERAGIQVENIVISPLAMTRAVLNEGEREFGATVIDMGGGQTTVATMRAQELQFTNIYPCLLYTSQENYKNILHYIGESFPNEYYKTYLPGLTIYQKPGYVREALNVDAIVMEDTPYMVAIYTGYLGGSTEGSDEISGWGLQQLGMLAYVINEWHRVNMN